jgi:hypothetical protein
MPPEVVVPELECVHERLQVLNSVRCQVVVEPPRPLLHRAKEPLYRVPVAERHVEPPDPQPVEGPRVPRPSVDEDDGLVRARTEDLLQEDEGVDVRPIVRGVDRQQLLRVHVDSGPDEDLPATDLEIRLVHRDDPPLPLLRDVRYDARECVDPSVDGCVTGVDQAGLVRHRAIGQSRQVEQAGNDLALERSFIPSEDVGLLDGFQKRIVGFHNLAISSGSRSAHRARRIDNQLKDGLS